MADDVKFGVLLSFKHLASGGWDAVRKTAMEFERLGYDKIWLGDHMAKGGYRLECWTTLSALSTVTNRIRLGPLVLCNSFRNPSLVAKMAATLDVISGGRLEFGIGAGFYWPEYHAYGIPFPGLSVRVKQLNEALEIIKRMWTQDKPSYKGTYYQIREAACDPKPLQKPHPPITLAGGNEQHTLKVVAKHADQWDFSAPVEVYRNKLRVLKEYCVAAGREFDEIEKSCFFTNVGVYPDEKELMQTMRRIYDMEGRKVYDRMGGQITFLEWFKKVRDRSIIGSPEQCTARIQEYLDIGVRNFILRFVETEKTMGRQLRIFMDKVIAKLPGKR